MPKMTNTSELKRLEPTWLQKKRLFLYCTRIRKLRSVRFKDHYAQTTFMTLVSVDTNWSLVTEVFNAKSYQLSNV